MKHLLDLRKNFCELLKATKEEDEASYYLSRIHQIDKELLSLQK
jgi:hypothetical protein